MEAEEKGTGECLQGLRARVTKGCTRQRLVATRELEKEQNCCGSTTAETRAQDWAGKGQRRNPKPLPWTTNTTLPQGEGQKGRDRLYSARPAEDGTGTLKN